MTAALMPRKWHHVCPLSKDLSFTCKPNSQVDIMLGRLLLQGANPEDVKVISRVQMQCATYCDFKEVAKPPNGTLVKIDKLGWTYTPNDNFVGADRFFYQIYADGQISLTGTITIYVR